MLDFSQMAGTPQAREMLFRMMAQQMGQASPDVREAISRVEVGIRRGERGFEIRIGESDHARVESMIRSSIESWSDLLARGFQAMGYRVRIYE